MGQAASPGPGKVSVDNEGAYDLKIPEHDNLQRAILNVRSGSTSEHAPPKPKSGMARRAQQRNRTNASLAAMELACATPSSAITIADDEKMADTTSPSMKIDAGSIEASSYASANLIGAHGISLPQKSAYGPDIPWSELFEQASSHIEGLESMEAQLQNKEVWKKRSDLTMAIWEAWRHGNFIGIDVLSKAAEDDSFHPNISVESVLGAWLALYPQGSYPIVHSHDSLPLFPKPDDPILTWKVYAEHGQTIAARKLRSLMTPVQVQGYLSLYARRLLAAMMLVRDGSRLLRRCFGFILAYLRPKLQYHASTLEDLCRGFAKHFPDQLSKSEERRILGHSDQHNAAAILAAVCYGHRGSDVDTNRDFKALHSLFQKGAQFSVKQAFVWAARMMLYYASPELSRSPLPSDLCARALSGCESILKTVSSHPPPHQDPDQLNGQKDNIPMLDEWQDTNFANLWVEWICYDSEFFVDNDLVV